MENLTPVEATLLVIQCSENLAQKLIEENNEILQSVSEIEKKLIKESIKIYYMNKFIEELRKKSEELENN